jgi:hypothetical protein
LIQATIVADSVGADAPRLTTFQLIYPRFIHAEVMTHRVFSRNASSSRAIPTAKMLAAISTEPARPVDWRMNQPGMQGYEPASDGCVATCIQIWDAACAAAVRVRPAHGCDRHSQAGGQPADRAVPAHPRCPHRDRLRELLRASRSRGRRATHPASGEGHEGGDGRLDANVNLTKWDWHLPYVDEEAIESAKEWFSEPSNAAMFESLENLLCRISAARCARVSYKTFDDKPSTVVADLDLYQKLVGSAPIHASPTEHQASPDFWLARGDRWLEPQLHGNLTGWKQFRKTLAGENLQGPVPSAGLAA